jgi:hypothetical protein
MRTAFGVTAWGMGVSRVLPGSYSADGTQRKSLQKFPETLLYLNVIEWSLW